ncbi:MAG: WD40 repeat domain-containing protein [Planctomycetaceae bacterium]
MSELKIEKPTLIWQMPFESESAWPIAVTFVGSNRVAAANQDGQLFVWELPSAPAESKTLWPVRRLDGHTNGVTRLVATPDGTLISASLDHSIRLWDWNAAVSGQAEVVMDREARQAEFKKTRKEEVLKRPGVYVETQLATHILDGHKDWIQSLGLSHDGKRLISGDDSAQLIVWDIATRKPLKRWSGHQWNWIAAAALSPDGESAIVSEYRYKRDDFDIPAAGLKVWSVGDGTVKLDVLKVQFPKLRSDETTYEAAQMWRKFIANGLIAADGSPDGKLFALGQGGETDTGKIHLIKSDTGELARSISGHQSGVTDVRFSADGKHLLSSGRDTTIRICQVEDGKEVAVLGAPRGGQFKDWFSALALSPDQRLVAAADIAGSIQIWSLANDPDGATVK